MTGQIEASDLASILTPKFSLQKKSKNTFFRSDTSDPISPFILFLTWIIVILDEAGH
jgi:hypothetical protein